jgi:hypothetical protein
MVGAVRALTEGGHQFDIVDSSMDLASYRVVILPDRIPASREIVAKVRSFHKAGGAVLASFESGLDRGKEDFALDLLPVRLRDDEPLAADGRPARGRVFHRTAYGDYIRPRAAWVGGAIEDAVRPMYTKAANVTLRGEAEVVADVVLPYFYRTYAHFCSHEQAPSSGRKDGPAAVVGPGVVYFAHAVFDLYARYAPSWVKAMVLRALEHFLPDPVLRHDGPSTLEAYVNDQHAPQRRVVHLLHYVPQRRAETLEIVEEALPLCDLHVDVRCDGDVVAARCVPSGEPVAYEQRDGRVVIALPKLRGHQMIELAY